MNNYIRMLYMALFVIAPILTNKITIIFGQSIPVGMFYVVVIMLGLIDVINYRMGLKEARKMIFEAMIIKLFIYLVLIPIAIVLPSAPFWHEQQEFAHFLHQTIRYFLASEIVTFVCQYYFDVKIFDLFKKYNWFVRSIGSDIISQAVTNIAMILLSFYGSGKPIIIMIISAFVFRMILSIIKSIILYPIAVLKKD